MNSISLRRSWLRYRAWFWDTLAGIAFIIFVIAAYWLMGQAVDALKDAGWLL